MVVVIIFMWKEWTKDLEKSSNKLYTAEGKNRVLREKNRKLILEKKIEQKKDEIMDYSRVKVRVVDLKEWMKLEIELKYPNNYQQKKMQAQNFLSYQINKINSDTKSISLTLPNFNETIKVKPMDCEKKIISPVLRRVKMGELNKSKKINPRDLGHNFLEL